MLESSSVELQYQYASNSRLELKLMAVTKTIFYRVQCALFYIENVDEVFPAHYTWKVAEKGFKMAFIMNKLAIINSCEIILEI